MQRGVEIRTFPSADLRQAVYDDLIAVVPEGASPYKWFYAVLSESDPRLARVYDVMAKYEIYAVPAQDAPNYGAVLHSAKGYFTRRFLHLFTPEEIDAAPYLLMRCHDSSFRVSAADTHPSGKMRICCPLGVKSQKLLVCDPIFLVHENFRPQLEAEDFIGLRLDETIPVRETGGRSEDFTEIEWPDGEAVFLLTSSVELPPMPTPHVNTIRGWEGTRFGWTNPGFDDICPVYRAVDFASFQLFDYASTWEQMPRLVRGEPRPIVSQRFRQFCLKHKMRFEFVPVKYVD